MNGYKEIVESQIERIVEELSHTDPGAPEYERLVKSLAFWIKSAVELKEEEPESKLSKVLSNPALLGLISNVVVSLLVLNFERAGIVTSRAFSFIKPK